MAVSRECPLTLHISFLDYIGHSFLWLPSKRLYHDCLQDLRRLERFGWSNTVFIAINCDPVISVLTCLSTVTNVPKSIKEKYRLRHTFTSHFRGSKIYVQRHVGLWHVTLKCSPLKQIKQVHCKPQHTLPPFHRGSAYYSQRHSESYGNLLSRIGLHHRLNMEVVVQSLFGLHVTWCAQLYSLAAALLVSKDRRHLFLTPWPLSFFQKVYCLHAEKSSITHSSSSIETLKKPRLRLISQLIRVQIVQWRHLHIATSRCFTTHCNMQWRNAVAEHEGSAVV